MIAGAQNLGEPEKAFYRDESKAICAAITEAIILRTGFDDTKSQVYAYTSTFEDSDLHDLDLENLPIGTVLDWHYTRVSKRDLQTWLQSSGYPLPDFLQTHDERSTSSEVDQGTSIPIELQAISNLIKGTHKYQAPELALAIKAWLGAADFFEKGCNTSSNPRDEIKAWLDDHIGDKDKFPTTAAERIATVANWNRDVGTPVRSL